jgi:hypothetical protein
MTIAPQLGAFTGAQIAFARAAWPLRAAEELRSALIYRALARACREIAFAAPWASRFAAVAREEVGHAALCAELGRALGADAPTYDASPVRARMVTLPVPTLRAAALALAEVAIGETISMTLFRAGRRGTTEPCSRIALERITADEVRHQRLGWDALTAWWPSIEDRDALQREAARALAASEQLIAAPALRLLERGAPFDPAAGALGVLAPAARVEAYYLAIESLVVPRLTGLGLDGVGAWDARYRA